jgi:hypothetical protein
MSNDSASDGQGEAAATGQPFVSPVPGLGAFTPPSNPYSQATWSYQRDMFLLLPLIIWTGGVLRLDVALFAIALALWALIYPIYGAWSLWRIKDANPKA